jgi:hypothetical protein
MHLESWAGFGLTAGIGTNAAVAGLAPFLLGYEPSETLVAFGLTNGQPSMTAVWPLERLADHASYTEPINAWAPQCDELYVLVCTEDPERCYDAAEALWYECQPAVGNVSEYRTIALSRAGWSDLNDFDRYHQEEIEFADHWSRPTAPHPVLARLFALAWQQALGDAHQVPAYQNRDAEAARRTGPIRVADTDLIPWAFAPARAYSIDLTSSADALAEVFDAVWRMPDPGQLNIAYWRTTGREPSTGTAQSIIASLTAFARWRWGLSGSAAEAAADAVEADPTSAIARAVARLVNDWPCIGAPQELVWAPIHLARSYGGPRLPVVDVPLHTEIRALVEPALADLLNPSIEGRDYLSEIRAVCGTAGRLELASLEHLVDTSTLLASRRLADLADAEPARAGLANVWGTVSLQSWGRTRGMATTVLLDGSGQVLHQDSEDHRSTWTTLPAHGPTGTWNREGLFRLAQALLRAERR